MPITGFKCPREGIEVPFDHFDTCTAGPAGRPACSPFLAAFKARSIREDLRHQGRGMTVTTMLMCPREAYLRATQEYHVDPTASSAADRGSALHSVAGKVLDKRRYITEETDPVRLIVEGKMFKGMFPPPYDEGIPISGKIDVVRIDPESESILEIIDWKFPKDWSVSYRKQRAEYRVQLSSLSMLLSQQVWAQERGVREGATPLLTIWDHALGRKEGPLAIPIDFMEEDEILEVTPYGGIYSIREHIESWIALQELHRDAGDPRVGSPEATEIASQVPLCGETQMNGQKCFSYCDVEGTCSRIARDFGRPVDVGEGDGHNVED